MKQIILLTLIILSTMFVAGCVLPTPTVSPTPIPATPTPISPTPVVSYYPTPVIDYTSYFNITGTAGMTDGTFLSGYTIDVKCLGDNTQGEYQTTVSDNGTWIVSFSTPAGYYDNFSVSVISPSKQLIYMDRQTRALDTDETADIIIP